MYNFFFCSIEWLVEDLYSGLDSIMWRIYDVDDIIL